MVFTNNQTAFFFNEGNQMGLQAEAIQRLQQEGLTTVADLADFDADTWKNTGENLRKPGGMIPDPANPGAFVPAPPVVFGAKSQKRLTVASDLVRYYAEVGREPTPANMQWFQVGRNFEIHWKALKSKKEEDIPDVPKITKALPVIKWTEAFRDFLARVIGARTIPLSYVIRVVEDVPVNAPNLAANQPYSFEHGSVEDELVARASHTHPLFRDDNASVYHYLEEATRGTVYAASIKPFQRTKNGRAAWLAMVSQYAGKDKYEAEIKRQEQLLHNREWKGNSHFTLEQFISSHRNAFVSMQASAEHVEYQLPNAHSRVGFLLNAIKTTDAGLQAAMASIRTDVDGMRKDFEAAAAHLLPYDPVAQKKTAGSKRDSSLISGVETEANVAASDSKPSKGKSGVHLRWHTKEEYKRLNPAQRTELREWRQANPDVSPPPNKRGKKGKQYYTKKQIDSLVSQRLKKESDEQKADEQARAAIMSLVKEAIAAPTLPQANAASVIHNPHVQDNAMSSLRTILGRTKISRS